MGALTLITALAAVLRFVGLTSQSLWLDEYLSAEGARQSASMILVQPDGEAPLYGLFLHALGRWGLTSDWWVRAPSALAGVLAVPVLYAVGRRVAGPRVALVAALLLAVHPFAIWQAQEARVYPITMLCALGSTWFFLRLLERPHAGDLFAYGGLACLGFGTHYYYVFVLATHAVAALANIKRHPERRRMWVSVGALALSGVVAWTPALVSDLASQAQRDEAHPFSWLAMPYTALSFVGGFSLGPSIRALQPAARSGVGAWDAVAPHVGVTALAIGVLAMLLFLAVTERRARISAVVIGMAVVPLLLPWLVSAAAVAFRPRYAAPALPFVLLLASAALQTRWPRTASVLVGLLFLLEVAGTAQREAGKYAREDSRGAAHYVAAHTDQAVTLLVGDASEPFRRYARRADHVRTVDPRDIDDAAALSRLLLESAAAQDVFLVSARPWTVDPEGRVQAELDRERPLRDRVDLAGVTVRRYGPRTDAAR